jgi:peptidoglycan-N-acetylglucosamine deacetylase
VLRFGTSRGQPVAARRAAQAMLTGVMGLAALTAHLAVRQPPWAVRLLSRQGLLLFAARRTTRDVAVTIDDGPTASLTPQLLEVLAAHDARATFFFLGAGVEAHPEVVAATRSAGHEIGNHGWLDRPAVRLSRRELRDDVDRTERAIARVTGESARFVRPGSGWLRPSHLREVRAMGCTAALGSIAVLDLEVRDVDRELAFVLDRLRPGSVIVLHEGRPERSRVVPLLDRLLGELARQDYSCVTLSELVDRPHSDR